MGFGANGDSYLAKEWNGQTLLAVFDGLGHGEEAAQASRMAKQYVWKHRMDDIGQTIQGLHKHLHGTRGVVAGLVRVDRSKNLVGYCGIGNVEVRIVGEPPMHPASLKGLVGARALLSEEYHAILHSKTIGLMTRQHKPDMNILNKMLEWIVQDERRHMAAIAMIGETISKETQSQTDVP